MRIATANLGRGVTVARFRANVVLLIRALAGAIICFQEIDEDDTPPERRIIGTLMRPGWWFAGRRTHVMIAIPRTWRRVGGRVQRASKGIPGVSPDRLIVTIIIRSLLRRSLPAIAIVNTHFPYANPHHSADKQAAARSAWHEVYEALVAEVDRLANLGHTIFICADTNDPDTPAPHPRARLLVGKNAIDKEWVVVASVDAELVATDTVDLSIDGHNAHVARLRLTSKESQ